MENGKTDMKRVPRRDVCRRPTLACGYVKGTYIDAGCGTSPILTRSCVLSFNCSFNKYLLKINYVSKAASSPESFVLTS